MQMLRGPLCRRLSAWINDIKEVVHLMDEQAVQRFWQDRRLASP